MPAFKNLNKEMKINQNMHNGSPIKRKERKEAERIFGEIMAKNFPNLMEKINLHILETQQIPVESTQRDPR